MAVGLHEIRVHLGLILTAALIKTLLPAWRFWILRHTPRRGASLASDVFFAAAWVLAVGVVWYDVHIALNERKVREVSATEFEVLLRIVRASFLQYLMAERFIAILILWCVKAAFLCFYWNVVAGIHTSVIRIGAWITAGTLIATFVAINTLFLTYCQPISIQWNVEAIITQTVCSPSWALMPQTVWLAFTIFTDLLILCFPLLFLRYLSLSSLERRLLPWLFVLGFLSIAPPIARYAVAITNHQYAASRHSQFPNVTLGTYHLTLILNELEDLGAFLAFCLPAFRLAVADACGCAKVRGKISAWSETLSSSLSKSGKSGRRDEPLVTGASRTDAESYWSAPGTQRHSVELDTFIFRPSEADGRRPEA